MYYVDIKVTLLSRHPAFKYPWPPTEHIRLTDYVSLIDETEHRR